MALRDGNPLRSIFESAAAAQAAQAAASATAQFQIEHYKQLEAAGMDPELARDIVIGTSTALFEMVAGMFGSITENAPAVADAFEKILNKEQVRGPST